jgi:copper chaperone CopZ
MEKLNLEVPAMYGDHHVVEVRRLLMALPGVDDVYASSCFQLIEVTYDPAQIDTAAIESTLAEAGYLDDLAVPVETGVAAYQSNGGTTYFRHSTAFEQTSTTTSFTQKVNFAGRPLWPCPGIGAIPRQEEGA